MKTRIINKFNRGGYSSFNSYKSESYLRNSLNKTWILNKVTSPGTTAIPTAAELIAANSAFGTLFASSSECLSYRDIYRGAAKVSQISGTDYTSGYWTTSGSTSYRFRTIQSLSDNYQLPTYNLALGIYTIDKGTNYNVVATVTFTGTYQSGLYSLTTNVSMSRSVPYQVYINYDVYNDFSGDDGNFSTHVPANQTSAKQIHSNIAAGSLDEITVSNVTINSSAGYAANYYTLSINWSKN